MVNVNGMDSVLSLISDTYATHTDKTGVGHPVKNSSVYKNHTTPLLATMSISYRKLPGRAAA
jgi:hypothetical protein